jgi:Arc/MetJ-type ribon-helix-helix transcriptional regulator
MSVEISSENQQFLDAAVASGVFPSRDAAINRALALLREQQQAIERIRAHPVPVPDLPPILERQADGYISVRGHRIGLHLILERYFAGAGEPELQDWFSSLSPIELEQIVSFVRSNPEAMRAYLDQQTELAEALYAAAQRGPTVEELRARWQRKFGRPFDSTCP